MQVQETCVAMAGLKVSCLEYSATFADATDVSRISRVYYTLLTSVITVIYKGHIPHIRAHMKVGYNNYKQECTLNSRKHQPT